jgi:hypothetical protein
MSETAALIAAGSAPLDDIVQHVIGSISDSHREKIPEVVPILRLLFHGEISQHDASARLEAIIGSAKLIEDLEASIRSYGLAQVGPPPPPVPSPRKSRNHWTPEEDDRLRAAVESSGADNWQLIASIVGGGRSKSQCSQRWFRRLDPRLDSSNWTCEEEQKLLDLLQVYGTKNWTRISREMGNRSDVQCRFRYFFMCKKATAAGTELRPVSVSVKLRDNILNGDPATADDTK